MRGFLIGAIPSAAPPAINALAGAAAPKHPVDAEEFLLQASKAPGADAAAVAKVQRLLRNKVKKCGGCGKPNGFTLATCNGCGGSLAGVDVSFSTNVFMCFVLGVAKGPFPLTISIRRQSADVLVLDDLLALSPLHFNAVPTGAHIPDWRYLLRRPTEGLQLIRKLKAELHATATEQFMANEAWRAVALAKTGGAPLPEDAYLCGFNFPPSQYQLHVQFMAPMLIPHHRYQYLRGTHYTPGRFFPFSYVEAMLEAVGTKFGFAGAGYPAELLQEDTPIEAICDYAAKELTGADGRPISYDEDHQKFFARANTLYEQYASWEPAQFRGFAGEEAAEGNLSVAFQDGTEAVTDAAKVADMVNQDKLALQNYGRPYTAEGGKPTGTYYSYPRDVASVDLW